MKKKILGVFALMFACLSSVVLLASCGVSEKTFKSISGDLTITLTSEFREQNMGSGYELVVASDDKIFMATKESFKILEDAGYSKDMSLEDYAEVCITNNSLSSSVVIDEEKNLVYFIYTKNISGSTFAYYAFVEKGGDAFWLCQFSCESVRQSKYVEQFKDWAVSIQVA